MTQKNSAYKKKPNFTSVPQTEDKVTEKWLCFFAKEEKIWYNIGKEARE